jgi:hypothetical protein
MKSASVRDRGSRGKPNRPGFFQNRVFRADVLFIRAENTVGAQSAQWSLGMRRNLKRRTPYLARAW